MKHLRPSRVLLAAVLAAAAMPAMAQTPAAPRGPADPYTQGGRVGDRFDPYSQGANASTRQDLAPESQPSTMPAQPGATPMQPDVNMPGTMQQRTPDPYTSGAQWASPNLGRPMGRPSNFLDGA
ncbi:endonuclease [Cupriavidus sp. WKF15]|uniref:endonuclease n=1 Tax=Cupriavidus sp. WKF15 TaxID=3032282 RepID=UPI0023E1A3BF|nr:endonuclease [Cupriavidus sp. WKF15]WER48534.1 endonuclease [Cupriavidus sp. WKF15]